VISISKRNLLITKSEDAFLLMKKQMIDLFSNRILIEKDSPSTNTLDFDLIVASYQNKRLEDFPIERQILAQHTIHVSFIEKLLQLPVTTNCYVASNTYEASIESIEMLKGFGIQLKMKPYPRRESELDENISTVITHDLQLILSERFSNVIDIGFRPLDFSTIVDIAVRLQLPISTHSVFKATNINEIVRLNHSLCQSIQQLKSVYQQLIAIINTSQDGIMTINSNNTIIQVNKTLIGFINEKFNGTALLGKNFSDVFPSFEQFQNKDHYLYSLNGLRLVVQQLPITLSNGEIGKLIIFREINKLLQNRTRSSKENSHTGFCF
jgi:PAS domain-containing protein